MAHQHYRKPFKKALLQFITELDLFLAMLKWVMTEMMRIEAEVRVAAAKGRHAKERATYFSGVRARRVDTRLRPVYLLVPKVRKGGYAPFFILERRRSEQALIAVVQEAFINEVSTGKIERLARAMGIESISAAQVSEFNKELDAQVADFLSRPLAEEYAFLWIDALCQYEENGRARPVRFERTTCGFEVRRSIQLSYGRAGRRSAPCYTGNPAARQGADRDRGPGIGSGRGPRRVS